MKILVIYNGSLNSKRALRAGIGEIKRHSGELIVLYVLNRVSFIDRDVVSRHISDAKRILEKENIKSDITLAKGNPADEITEHVREKNIDIILSAKKRYKLNYENGG